MSANTAPAVRDVLEMFAPRAQEVSAAPARPPVRIRRAETARRIRRLEYLWWEEIRVAGWEHWQLRDRATGQVVDAYLDPRGNFWSQVPRQLEWRWNVEAAAPGATSEGRSAQGLPAWDPVDFFAPMDPAIDWVKLQRYP